VFIDSATLMTLPQREFAAGLAEVIKYGVILDPELFALLERELDQVLALDEALLRRIVRRCCELKAMVVQCDERESEYRAILNFGHTAGHAIETLTGYQQYLHGEAVAIGMVFAARLSCSRGFCGTKTAERITTLLRRAGLPVDMPRDLSQQQLADTIQGDKKVSGGKVKFVCVEDLGRTRFEYFTGTEVAALAAK
jgi:3-dehydroquinate synthase